MEPSGSRPAHLQLNGDTRSGAGPCRSWPQPPGCYFESSARGNVASQPFSAVQVSNSGVFSHGKQQLCLLQPRSPHHWDDEHMDPSSALSAEGSHTHLMTDQQLIRNNLFFRKFSLLVAQDGSRALARSLAGEGLIRSSWKVFVDLQEAPSYCVLFNTNTWKCM